MPELLKPSSAAVLAAALLAVLASAHFYWALGGTIGKDGAIPSVDGRPLLRPSRIGTAGIGGALLVGATLLMLLGDRTGGAPPALARLGGVGMALVFLLRAVGDFRTVGFFKRIKGSVFAARDLYVYSPLCLILSAMIGWAAVR